MTPTTGTVPRLMDTHEAAAVLGVSYDWLKRRAARREVPHTRLGKHVKFTPEHLAAIVAEGERAALAPRRGSARTTL